MSNEIEQKALHFFDNNRMKFTGINAGEYLDKEDFFAFINSLDEQPSSGLIEVEDLQKQVRDHIKAHDLFDWHEALTENEMTLLENLLLTFAPMFSPGSVGFEQTVRPYLKSLTDEPVYQILNNENNWVTIDKDWYDRAKETHRRIITKSQPTDEPDAGYWLEISKVIFTSIDHYREAGRDDEFNIKSIAEYLQRQLKQTPAKDEDEK